jgi:ankyrin repeat protein
MASRNGHVEIVRFMLNDNHIDPSARDNEAIRMASRNGHVEVVRLLLSDNRVGPSAFTKR